MGLATLPLAAGRAGRREHELHECGLSSIELRLREGCNADRSKGGHCG